MVVLGQAGFDEGGVMQALSRPVWKRVSRHVEYNSKGLLEDEDIDELNISLLTVLAPLVLAGVITLSPFFMERLKDLGVESALTQNAALALYGPVLGPIVWAGQQANKEGNYVDWKKLFWKFVF